MSWDSAIPRRRNLSRHLIQIHELQVSLLARFDGHLLPHLSADLKSLPQRAALARATLFDFQSILIWNSNHALHRQIRRIVFDDGSYQLVVGFAAHDD